jgi:hypothetical protein
MLARSASIGTAAFQLWVKPELAALGWPLGETVLTAYVKPFDSWGVMTHLLERESWDAADPGRAKSLHYFCGAVPDVVRDGKGLAARWLGGAIHALWPAANPLPPDPAVVAASYYRVNTAGSERYVQTPRGSVKHRLASGEPVFRNLYVAGDWTRTRFSGGCVEAAFESGMLAARGICERAAPWP